MSSSPDSGKRAGLTGQLPLLLAVGSSIFVASAVAAAAPVIPCNAPIPSSIHPHDQYDRYASACRLVRKSFRRAFTNDEMQCLLGVAGKRKVVYLTAVYTGLRRSELAELEHLDLHLDGEKPFVNVRASTTKNHQQAVIALHPELVAELRTHVAKMPAGTSKVFAGVMPTMTRFKMDLKAAGIPFLNAAGQRADFHSLRHTLATNLARAGTAPRVAMEIMRHSDMRLTAKTYTDAGLFPVADAVLKLPFLSKPKDTGTQDLFRAGHDLSTTGTTVAGIPLLGLSGNEQLGHEKESPVQTGQNLEMVRGTGFERVGPALQQQALAEPRVPGRALVLAEPDLAAVVIAWPTLSSATRAAISALVMAG